MSSTTQYTDFSDLYNGLLRAIRDSTTVTATVNEAKRAVNTALHDMHMGEDRGSFWWAERRARIVTAAPYSTGTVDIAAATRTTVTGTSTLWNTTVSGLGVTNAAAGYKFRVSGETEVYAISAVGSDTSITLTDTYTGDAVDDESYTVFADEYALASDFGEPIDSRNFSDEWEIPIIGSREFYRRYPRNTITGRPKVCTFVVTGLSSVLVQRKVLFHRVPDAVYSIPYRYVTTNLAMTSSSVAAAQLTSDTDQPIIPLRFRHVLFLYALYHWYRDRKDDAARAEQAKAEYIDLVRRIRSATNPSQDRPRLMPTRPVRPRGRFRATRYDINDRFEQMRD